MTARVILVSKVNSHPFDDRVLLLDVPSKIGRAHKDDQVSVLFRAQSFTSLVADLHQDINRVSSFSRCLNGAFP